MEKFYEIIRIILNSKLNLSQDIENQYLFIDNNKIIINYNVLNHLNKLLKYVRDSIIQKCYKIETHK